MGCGVGCGGRGGVGGFKQAVFSKDFSAKISKMMIPFLNLTV